VAYDRGNLGEACQLRGAPAPLPGDDFVTLRFPRPGPANRANDDRLDDALDTD
jgi:hypothetical protein